MLTHDSTAMVLHHGITIRGAVLRAIFSKRHHHLATAALGYHNMFSQLGLACGFNLRVTRLRRIFVGSTKCIASASVVLGDIWV